MTPIDRRRFLAFGGAALAGGALWTAAPPASAAPPAATAPTGPAEWRGGRSANGWPVLTAGGAPEFRVEGSGLTVRLAPAAAPVLLHVVRRFLYEVEHRVGPGELTGHVEDRRVAAPYESAYLSGSGIALRPLFYPLGARDGFFEHEKAVVRDILADCEGVVAWGGDLMPVKESHFHVVEPPTSARYLAVAAKLRRWEDAPGRGAGAVSAFTG